MQTRLLPNLVSAARIQRADEILRKCVHCGFCTATCPTYQLLGDELDGPRGRIYQTKRILEGEPADRETQLHLDRCLTCRSCETTCPSGVDYAELIDIGRHYLEQQDLRPWPEKVMRQLLGSVLPYPGRHALLFRSASYLRGFMPAFLKAKTPVIRSTNTYPDYSMPHRGKVLLLEGCVQKTLSPNTNAAAESVLKAMGYQVIRETKQRCCGAVNEHLNQHDKAMDWIIGNLQQWQRLNSENEIAAIVSTASGCGIMLKDYAKILKPHPAEAEAYQSLLTKIKDISELLDAEVLLNNLKRFSPSPSRIAYHAPCTLTHGHQMADHIYNQLVALGYQLELPRDAHLCCGSAGTYSLLQPQISVQLRDDKLRTLEDSAPDMIITANVGCEHHLNSATSTKVIHWIELVAGDL